MAHGDEDLSIRQLFRVIFIQGGQVAVGTAIGMGVVLLVGIVAVFLAPIWLPIFAVVYWRRERRRQAEVVVDSPAEAAVAEPSRLEPPSESR